MRYTPIELSKIIITDNMTEQKKKHWRKCYTIEKLYSFKILQRWEKLKEKYEISKNFGLIKSYNFFFKGVLLTFQTSLLV